MLSSRPHLISSDRTVELGLESSKPAHLVIDGQAQFDVDQDVLLRVKRSADPALFVDVGRNFFEKVDRKVATSLIGGFIRGERQAVAR